MGKFDSTISNQQVTQQPTTQGIWDAIDAEIAPLTQDNTMQEENKQSKNINILDEAQNMNEVSHRLNISTYIRQLEETITLIQNSKNADIVVSRLQFLESIRDKLKSTSYSELDNVINSINKVLDNKIGLINMAIQRNLDSELEKIRELKTEKGRLFIY